MKELGERKKKTNNKNIKTGVCSCVRQPKSSTQKCRAPIKWRLLIVAQVVTRTELNRTFDGCLLFYFFLQHPFWIMFYQNKRISRILMKKPNKHNVHFVCVDIRRKYLIVTNFLLYIFAIYIYFRMISSFLMARMCVMTKLATVDFVIVSK